MAYLLVIDNESSSIFHLPSSGDIVLGRGNECGLQLLHGSVSRRHATIRVDAGGVRIADLGSRNGTRVNGETVEQARELASGDIATIGDVVLVARCPDTRAPSRELHTEAGWRRRLAEEIERALSFHRSLAVVAIVAPELPVAALVQELRAFDVIRETRDGYFVLLPEVGREQARHLGDRIHVLAPRARLGLTMCPADAVEADAILRAARSAAQRAEPGSIVEPSASAIRVALEAGQLLIGDPAMQRVFALAERLAATDAAILISGEPGSGKATAARAVHRWSTRTGAFVAVDCANVDPCVVEHELETAASGTLFVASAEELAPALRDKLIRAIDERRARIVVGVTCGLGREKTEQRFGRDLARRLRRAIVVIPPLRDRCAEIPLFASSFLADARARMQRSSIPIGPTAMQLLLTYRWPGNVRELREVMEHAAVTAHGMYVEPRDLPEYLEEG